MPVKQGPHCNEGKTMNEDWMAVIRRRRLLLVCGLNEGGGERTVVVTFAFVALKMERSEVDLPPTFHLRSTVRSLHQGGGCSDLSIRRKSSLIERASDPRIRKRETVNVEPGFSGRPTRIMHNMHDTCVRLPVRQYAAQAQDSSAHAGTGQEQQTGRHDGRTAVAKSL